MDSHSKPPQEELGACQPSPHPEPASALQWPVSSPGMSIQPVGPVSATPGAAAARPHVLQTCPRDSGENAFLRVEDPGPTLHRSRLPSRVQARGTKAAPCDWER